MMASASAVAVATFLVIAFGPRALGQPSSERKGNETVPRLEEEAEQFSITSMSPSSVLPRPQAVNRVIELSFCERNVGSGSRLRHRQRHPAAVPACVRRSGDSL